MPKAKQTKQQSKNYNKKKTTPSNQQLNKDERIKREQFLKEMWGLTLFCLAAFVFISIRFPATTGFVGYWVIEIIGHSLVGKSILYLPYFLVLTAISFFYGHSKWKQTIAAVSTGFFAFTIIMELSTNGYLDTFSPITSINAGGIIGHTGLYIFHKIFGLYGTLVILSGLFFVAPFLIFNVSVVHTLKELKLFISKINNAPNKKNNGSDSKSSSTKKSSLTALMHLLFFTTKKETFLMTSSLPAPKIKKTIPSSKKEPVSINESPVKEFELPNFDMDTPLPTSRETKKTSSKQTDEPIPILKEPKIDSEGLISSPEIESVPEKLAPTISLPKKLKLPKLTVAPPSLTSLSKKEYVLPPLSLIADVSKLTPNSKENLERYQTQATILEETLQSFNVNASVVNITPGPSVTRYELKPGEGVKIAKITSLSNDIALKLASNDIRIEAPIPGKSLIGIEVPNASVDMITLRTIIEKTNFYDMKETLLCGVGLTITGDAICMNIEKLPHILIAGATGAGKSVCINSIILSLIMRSTPDQVKFLMIDPKKVELSLFEGIPHLLAPVVTNADMAAATLKKWALAEMETRYDNFSKAGVKNIEGYNKLIISIHKMLETDPEKARETIKECNLDPADAFSNLDQASIDLLTGSENSESENENEEPEQKKELFIPQKLPHIVVIIDELADLMMVASAEVETTICRLAQMSRATGIHLVIATQRPSVNVVTGLIKANVPSRISFFLQSQIDSRTILDMGGAEKLLGKGDMLFSPVGSFKPKRVQGVYVSEKEVKSVVKFWKDQESPNYVKEILEVTPLTPDKKEKSPDDKDEYYNDAKDIVINTKYASTSYLQRKLKIGYNRAARIMEELEADGIISEYAGEKKPRTLR
ncbi:DNA translocase FtsK [bacterium]|jgi:DNA segregation ATPase FtsK/SpoIIIE, S-DNA-T family|nr:DNA translocase FtsK [bacterium]